MNYYLYGNEVYAYDDYQVNVQGYPHEPMQPITEEQAMSLTGNLTIQPLEDGE